MNKIDAVAALREALTDELIDNACYGFGFNDFPSAVQYDRAIVRKVFDVLTAHVEEGRDGERKCVHPEGCTSCNWCGWKATVAPSGSIGDEQDLEIAARIFGFKPHKQTPDNKALWLDLFRAIRAARTPAIVGSIGEDAEFRRQLDIVIKARTYGGWAEGFNSFAAYIDTITQGARK